MKDDSIIIKQHNQEDETMKTLIFEGAGWKKAESNGVGNCRIRTRLKTNEGRIIYLECGGRKKTKYDSSNFPFNFTGHIDHVFYDDVKEDAIKNFSPELCHLSKECFEYTKREILKFVNNKLGCSFADLKVQNNNEVRVHETLKHIC